jgi:hypothetical protein
MPPLLAFDDAVQPENQVRIVEHTCRSFKVQTIVPGLIDPVLA